MTESALFATGESAANGPSTVPRGTVRSRILDILGKEQTARLPAGAYWCDYASPLAPQMIVRAVLIVMHLESSTIFRRFTGYGERVGSFWGGFKALHEGIVLEKRGTFFFTAINTIGFGEPSMLVVKPAAFDELLFSGTATIMTKDGSEVLAVAISRAPAEKSLLSVIRKSRTYDVDTPDIPMKVIDMLGLELDHLADVHSRKSPLPQVAQ